MTETRMQKEAVKEKAKKIMDDFMLALDKVRDIDESFGMEVKDDKRKVAVEGGKAKGYKEIREDFRNRMFKNAPKVNDDYIQAEKKSW